MSVGPNGNARKSNLSNNLPILIAGPTGVGKTRFAVALAQRVGGELLCADAFQVYAGFRLLTARPTPEEETAARHHLFGVVPPSETWDVARQLRSLEECVAEVQARGRRPILVGGTGLYFQAFLQGLDEMPPGDPGLRRELERKSPEECLELLASHDPGALELIDRRNPRRILRALEIVLLSGRSLQTFRQARQRPLRPCEAWFLDRESWDLRRRQEANIARMVEEGVLAEVARVRKQGVGPTAERALGYREFCAVLDGEMTLDAAVQKLGRLTWQYARRQRTWFRHAAAFQQRLLSVNE